MPSNNSLVEVDLIASLVQDVYQKTLPSNARAARLTIQKIRKRTATEGMGFLTKTLPRLGKAFDRALSGDSQFDQTDFRLKRRDGSQLPMLFGELFELVFDSGGTLLPSACPTVVRHIRQLLYLFYKYELPYTKKHEEKILTQFKETEEELINTTTRLAIIGDAVTRYTQERRFNLERLHEVSLVRRARSSLYKLLEHFHPREIHPRHGPGAVAQKEQFSGKYQQWVVPDRIAEYWPIDEYFYSSLGAVCDLQEELCSTRSEERSARVVLVPKDSRGPRLISAEPKEFQWIQQGLMRALVDHVERHPITRDNVHFTDQQPNQYRALIGSRFGDYATLDLKEASDRISCELVKLLFPPHHVEWLMRARSLSTQLPSGETLNLLKYAPMGSALCFPVLALSIWSLLRAAAPDKHTEVRVLVYGDDIVVPTNFVETAIAVLSHFGLVINRDKSCTKGFFRESCGTDAFKGEVVTPVRLRTVWSVQPSASVFTSWVAYANSFYERGYYSTHETVVRRLDEIYYPIADETCVYSPVRLIRRDISTRRPPRRVNSDLQRLEYLALETRSVKVTREMHGWKKLLRYFAEHNSNEHTAPIHTPSTLADITAGSWDASSYTKRSSSILVRRWR